MHRHQPWAARDADAGAHFQTFFVSAVAAILATRLYLQLAGFPRIGAGGLHIAHMLWGGLLMLTAQLLFMGLLGKRARHAGAIIGGVGFGLFVDELGKFITVNNDYFFQPTIALIYLLFVSLFLVFRAVERQSLSDEELLVNAADTVKELILNGATTTEVARGLRLLELSGAHGPLVDGVHEAILGVACAPESKPSLIAWSAAHGWRLYDRVIAWRWFQRTMLTVFVLQALAGVAESLVPNAALLLRDPSGLVGGVTFRPTLGLGASLVSLALVLPGVVALPTSRGAAYRWFERSILVSIFVTQVILFWQDQLTALSGLAFNLVLLSLLRYLIRQEDGRRAVAGLQNTRSRSAFSGPTSMPSSASPTSRHAGAL